MPHTDSYRQPDPESSRSHRARHRGPATAPGRSTNARPHSHALGHSSEPGHHPRGIRARTRTSSVYTSAEAGSVGKRLIVVAGLGLGLLLSVATLLGWTDGPVMGFGAAVVLGVLTAVAFRRGTSAGWLVCAVLGGLAAALAMSRIADLGWPDWWSQALAAYALAVAGADAILLTRPVRRLSELPTEYGISVLVALAGAGVAAVCLDGTRLGAGAAGTAVVVGLGLALIAATRARTRLNDTPISAGLRVYFALFVTAVLVGVAATAVIVVHRDTPLSSELVAGVRPLIVLPLALLGPGLVVRTWTPVGWWLSAVGSVGAVGVAITFGAEGTAGGRLDAALSMAVSAVVGAIVGAVLTIVVALVVSSMMRSAAPDRRPVRRTVVEPDRLSALT